MMAEAIVSLMFNVRDKDPTASIGGRSAEVRQTRCCRGEKSYC